MKKRTKPVMNTLVVISKLRSLEKDWPDNLMLFAAAGMLCLVNRETGKIIYGFPNITCDGGDPDTQEGADEKTYITSGLI